MFIEMMIIQGLNISLIAWWYYPILSILTNNWTQFYDDFTGLGLFPPEVKSYNIEINPKIS